MKKRGFSLFPKTTAVHSAYSGTLEINSWLGTTTLDSSHSNYSYGTLQKVLKYGITVADLPELQHILILGMGGGSVIHTLRNDFRFTGHIKAVEIDPEVIRIAADVFDVRDQDGTAILCMDAAEYVKTCASTFDLIIVDLFIGDQVPVTFLSAAFWKCIASILSHGGTFIFNYSMHAGDTDQLASFTASLSTLFAINVHQRVLDTNTLIIGKHRVS